MVEDDLGAECTHTRGWCGLAGGGIWAPILGLMSSRLDKSWTVLVSHQTAEANRCVDVFRRPDGSFGFEEFRRDPEDMGRWTAITYFSGHEYPTESDAMGAAVRSVPWLGPLLDR
jgi:hypothetical protein